MQLLTRQSDTDHAGQRRILVVATHDATRKNISALLGQQSNLAVIAQARSGDEAVRLAVVHQPDIVLLDVATKGLPCADACQEILHRLPGTRIILLTSFLEDERLTSALRAGAAGYVLRRISSNELLAILSSYPKNSGDRLDARVPAISEQV